MPPEYLLCGFIGLFTVYTIWDTATMPSNKPKLEEFKWLKGDEAWIHISYAQRWPSVERTHYHFRGSATVWNYMGDGSRASTHMENYLCGIWTKKRWERDD